MGLSCLDLRVLHAAYNRGARFGRVASIGRARLNLHGQEIRLLSSYGITSCSLRNYKWKDYADRYFCELFGTEQFVSVDYNDYEGASIIHDMNIKIPQSLTNSFDLVIDGGSLEHIFDFPIAMKNVIAMTKPGGHVLTINPANNLCGHGFYQFSPELMFRIFSDDNGFDIEEMLLSEHHLAAVEAAPARRVVRVRDPKVVCQRIIINNRRPLMLRTLARKQNKPPPLITTPQQSDYVVLWNAQNTSSDNDGPSPSIMRRLYAFLPNGLRCRIASLRRRYRYRFSNRQFFEPYLGTHDSSCELDVMPTTRRNPETVARP